MPPTLTARDRASLLAAALAQVDEPDLRAALDRVGALGDVPRSVVNAAKALRRGRGVAAAVGRPPYRAVVPFLATVVADECLARAIEVLGDASDDPTSEQLTSALEEVRGSFSDTTIGVMLASVGTDDMPASALCLELVTSDERYGLTGWRQPDVEDGAEAGSGVDGEGRPGGHGADGEGGTTGDGPGPGAGSVATTETGRAGPEQRDARRRRRRAAAEERRRQEQTAKRAVEQVRSARKKERKPAVSPGAPAEVRPSAPAPRAVPTLVRRPVLTPSQLQEFDPDDPLVGALVYLWVPYDRDTADGDEERPGAAEAEGDDGTGEPSAEGPATTGGGKLRPCVVVGVGHDQVLVRAGYSEGGRKSRDWTSVPLQHWRKLGLEQPTWIGSATLRLPRPELSAPPSRLAPSDWNSLW